MSNECQCVGCEAEKRGEGLLDKLCASLPPRRVAKVEIQLKSTNWFATRTVPTLIGVNPETDWLPVVSVRGDGLLEGCVIERTGDAFDDLDFGAWFSAKKRPFKTAEEAAEWFKANV